MNKHSQYKTIDNYNVKCYYISEGNPSLYFTK